MQQKASAEAGGLLTKNVLTSGGRRQWEFLHVKVIEATGLPAMDTAFLQKEGTKIDAVCEVRSR